MYPKHIRAAITVIAEHLAQEIIDDAIDDLAFDEINNKNELKNHFQIIAEDDSELYIAGMSEDIEQATFEVYNKLVKKYVKDWKRET